MSYRSDLSPSMLPVGLLRRMDIPGPRYTSYPTADRFSESFGPQSYREALRERGSGSRLGGSTSLSVYVHIPFCDTVCYYCACNKVVTRHHSRAGSYLNCLLQEIDLHTEEIGLGQPLSQLHLGGGTPTFLADDELAQLMLALRRAFQFLPAAEISIEVDPRTASPDRLRILAGLGFNRVSFGVQDLDPDVQEAIHRVQPHDLVRDLVHAARSIGLQSINADLIYGLPRQTPESFARTVAQVGALRPDRIALYAYAHLPDRFKAQRRIADHDLPTGDARIQMLSQALAGFMAQGYSHIGLDHFALPSDSLAIAKKQGRLHRNFQGYSTQPDCDLIGLGVSAIGRMGACYAQNAKTIEGYESAMRAGRFATERGLRAGRDDLMRRAVIMALMCQGRVDFESIELAHLVPAREYFAAEVERLAPFVQEGLVEIDEQGIQLTPLGWFFVRGVAMVFDRHLQTDRDHARFSRII